MPDDALADDKLLTAHEDEMDRSERELDERRYYDFNEDDLDIIAESREWYRERYAP